MALTLCLAGCGGQAQKVYKDSLIEYAKHYGGVEYLACCDIDSERARIFCVQTRFKRFYTGYPICLPGKSRIL